MLTKIIRKSTRKKRCQSTEILSQGPSGIPMSLSKKLEDNRQAILTIFPKADDLVIRELTIGTQDPVQAFAVMIFGLFNEDSVNENLIKPLLSLYDNQRSGSPLKIIKDSILTVSSVQEVQTIDDAVTGILSGDTALFIDGADSILIASIRGWEARGVEEPETESVVRGPREGFVESLGTNISLIRRKIKNPNLMVEKVTVGKQTKTSLCILHIHGIANDEIVQEVKDRIGRIETDSVLESGYIESFIEDAPYSLFPTIGNSEKPDIVCAKLLEGRIAILTDGTPFVLTVPYLFVEAFQNSEDYYSRPYLATFIRWLRWLSFFISTFVPALYVAITTYHQELLPTSLLISIASANEGSPFPTIVEALLMQIAYEILREAGLRLPKAVGQAVSIVGALVIGEAAVSAGLVGAPMVVVVALTGISSFVVPALTDVTTIARFALLILSSFAGLYGVMLGFAGFVIHQLSLRSFGVPYMSPLVPLSGAGLTDVIIRKPWWAMTSRPPVLSRNTTRQANSLTPRPPEDPGTLNKT
ncbi:spore germination protein, GerA family [Desulfosporosinus acidiphilus SJ4]|uniref:Spore germination protein, GerA family n=1 Tax=Desulfosporosinus acidiphilus (strain DSM 22704 / JCM 16185 / SJ4) TaxID=646529 RepID=I4D0C7_DESAJ|nr:spore germination protein [Desulfosporosinus acidiphilus]AFM39251.1 spore germination protein, GerA family [Desulfosporosinus acidiphilus SJ4]